MREEKGREEQGGGEGRGRHPGRSEAHRTGREEPPLEVSERISQARVKAQGRYRWERRLKLGRKQKSLNGQLKHLDLLQ